MDRAGQTPTVIMDGTVTRETFPYRRVGKQLGSVSYRDIGKANDLENGITAGQAHDHADQGA